MTLRTFRSTLFRLGCWLALCTTTFAVPFTANRGPGGIDSPVTTSDLRVWMDADDLAGSLTDGTNVSTWVNRVNYVGAPGNATVGNTAPTFENVGGDLLNGHAVLDFSGASGLSTGDILTGSGTFTADKTFFVVSRLEQADGGCCAGPLHTANFNGIGVSGGNVYYTDYGGGGPAGGPAMLNQWGLFTGFYRNGSAPRTSTFVNGSATGNENSGGTDRGVVGNSYIVGSRTTNGDVNGRFFDGQIAEVGIFNGMLNSAERRIVENYLSGKYNTGSTIVAVVNSTLGARDHYAGDLASNGHYDFDIFGVGRESLGVEHLNSGAAGFGIEVTDGSLGDEEWLFAGHNGDPNGFNGLQWDRLYYVDKSGAVNATLAFDYSDAGLNTPNSTDPAFFHLLYSAVESTDPNDFTDLMTAASVTGDTVTFNVADGLLLDGYYTISFELVVVPEPGTWALVSLGALGLAWRVRRRR